MAMITPYYEQGGITIYCGDCREILPELPKADLVLTDPPYGINLPTDYASRKRGVCKIDYLPVYDDDKPFAPEHLKDISNQIILWGGNYYADKLPAVSGWLVWDKRYGMGQNDQADCELAWTNCIKGVRILHHRWNGYNRDSESKEHYHPTQKPVTLMSWCISQVDKWGIVPQTILDPYLGGGSTLLAAKKLGRKAIGIEIEEKYCEIAVKRLSQSVMKLEC